MDGKIIIFTSSYSTNKKIWKESNLVKVKKVEKSQTSRDELRISSTSEKSPFLKSTWRRIREQKQSFSNDSRKSTKRRQFYPLKFFSTTNIWETTSPSSWRLRWSFPTLFSSKNRQQDREKSSASQSTNRKIKPSPLLYKFIL